MYPESQAHSITESAFRQAMLQADTARKGEAARKLAYFHDEQVPFIQEMLSRKHNEPERFDPVFLNIVKKVIKALAMVYLQDAVRAVDGSDQDKAIYAEIETTAALPVKMKLANRYSRLCGNVMLRPVWRDGRMELDVLTPDTLNVIIGSTPEDVLAVMVTFHAESGRVDEIEYDLWTAEAYQRLDYSGNVLKAEPNPYGVIPVVSVFSHAPTESYWQPGANDLVVIQDAINHRLVNTLFTQDLQGFGVPFIKGTESTEEIHLGAGSMLYLPEKGEIGFAAPNAPTADNLAVIEFLMKHAAVTNGLPAATMNSDPTKESGVSKIVGNAELEEQRRDDIALFAQYEQQLFQVFRTVWNVHNPHRKMSVAATLRVNFYDPKPSVSGYEQAKEWRELTDMGLISPVDILIERDPDLTREEAKARLLEIRAEIKEFGQTQDYMPSFGSFPGIPNDYNNLANPA